QSIALDFNNFTSGLMFNTITQHLYNRVPAHTFEAFGWATDPNTGAIQCLPMLGGCTVSTIQNLLGVLWDSRDQLLYVAGQTQVIFPGFGGLLCWIWSGIVQQVDCEETPASELQSIWAQPASELQSIWAQFVDILIRFTLCSNECEAQLASRLYVACDKFGDVPTVHLRTKNTVNDRDSARIGIETARKLGSDPGLSLDLTTALVAYSGPNINFSGYIIDIMEVAIERLCIELDDVHQPLVAYSGPNINFSGYIIDIMEVAIERLCIELDDVHQPADLAGNLIAHCEMCFFTLSKITEHDPRGLIRLFDLMSEELFEALGRIVLLPLCISGLHTIGGSGFSTGQLVGAYLPKSNSSSVVPPRICA
ncbi:unnamed protein product, partial [Rhizoctonia solani]